MARRIASDKCVCCFATTKFINGCRMLYSIVVDRLARNLSNERFRVETKRIKAARCTGALSTEGQRSGTENSFQISNRPVHHRSVGNLVERCLVSSGNVSKTYCATMTECSEIPRTIPAGVEHGRPVVNVDATTAISGRGKNRNSVHGFSSKNPSRGTWLHRDGFALVVTELTVAPFV